MPLEKRVQLPRTYQRKCRGTRQRPYSLPTNLAETRREGVTLELTTTERDAPVRVPFELLAKRHGACVCTIYDGPMHANNVRSGTLLEDETEEPQRIPTEQQSQTNPNRSSWRSENIMLRSNLMNLSSHSIPTNERLTDSTSSDSSTSSDTSDISELSSMIPNVVPILSPSELAQSLASVTTSNHLLLDAVQTTQTQSTPSCKRQDSSNSDQLDQLTNHDRSVEECTASPIQEFNCICSRATFRLRRSSMSDMTPLSAHAQQVANRVIKHARVNKTPDELSLWCPDCRRLPVLPVTGQCGHTRCTNCIQDNGVCPCGALAPKNLHVNTLIQGLIKKMLPKEPYSSDVYSSHGEQLARKPLLAVRSRAAWGSNRRQSATRTQRHSLRAASPKIPPYAIMSLQARFELASQLVSCRRPRDAAPHLARIAASPTPLARVARALLAQCITVLSRDVDPRRLTRELYRAVRAQAAGAWLDARELECALCYHAYTSPVSTPCGHTYCRTCIERSMDYRKSCALCLRSLEDFDLASTRDTVFVCAALESIDALRLPAPPDPDVIPIFVCTVAYPAIPCPLFIFDPRYWLMIRRVLESGSRKFGMVSYERDRSYSDYGTVLEVRDCVHLEDGRSILSTVGVSRFRVIERDVRDGCDVARIQPLTDIPPTEGLVIWDLRIMATQISYKALLWLNSMSAKVRSEIEAAFGQLPHFDHRQEDWWDSPDGPAWLWWLIAILPLRSEIKILILSTKNLLKRMMAVSRTLDAIDQVAISAATSSECELRNALNSAEEWLERGA